MTELILSCSFCTDLKTIVSELEGSVRTLPSEKSNPTALVC